MGELNREEEKHVGRPRKGKQVREVITGRLEPEEKERIIQKFGGIQAFIDEAVKKLLKDNNS